ncbi:MAG TPA: TRAP transporter substrate-binding protein [Casimicrobiaceae bacterium]|jgi:TRAP-type mannitol/chloroaromatic compound transport system substrate-binding protein
MERRSFLKKAGVGLAAGVVAAPVIGQGTQPEVKWRMASSFPKALDTIFGGAVTISQRCAAATNGKFQIQVFAAGEIVPAFGVVDAVQNGTVESANTAPYYFFGKDPTFAFAAAIPFGLNTRQQNAWMYHGGGLALMREFYKDYNMISFPSGNTGAQMGGWFRKEIKTVADLKGLKFRIGGTGALPLAKLGVVPQQIAGGDIYPALEKGTIDAAEWVGPYDDEKLGFYKVAKNYYYPGWWEGSTEVDSYVNLKAWEALPKDYQAIFEAACYEANMDMTAKYDSLNPAALKRLIGNGVKLQPFSNEILAACYKATTETYDEIAAKNAKFKKIYEPWKAFRAEQVSWFAVTENRFDNFMIAAERLKAGKGKFGTEVRGTKG